MCDALCTRCAEWKKKLFDCILGQSGDGKTSEVAGHGFLDEPHAIEGQEDEGVRQRGEIMLSSVHAWDKKVAEKNESDNNIVTLGNAAQGIAQVGLTRKFVSTGDLTKKIEGLNKKPAEEEYGTSSLSSLSIIDPPQTVAKPRPTKPRRKIRRRHSYGHLTPHPTIYEDRAFEDPTTRKIIIHKQKPKPWIPPPPSTPPPPLHEPIYQRKKRYTTARCLLIFVVGVFVQMRRSTTLGLLLLTIPVDPPKISKKSWRNLIRIIIDESGEISEQFSILKSQNLHLHVNFKAGKKREREKSTVVGTNSSTLAIYDAPSAPPIPSLLSNEIIIAEDDDVEETSNQTEIHFKPILATTTLQRADHEEELSLVCSESTTQPKGQNQNMCTLETASEERTSLEQNAQQFSSSTDTEALSSSSSINSTLSNEITTEGEDEDMKPHYLLEIDTGRGESFHIRLSKILKLLSRNPISNAWSHFRSRRRLRKCTTSKGSV